MFTQQYCNNFWLFALELATDCTSYKHNTRQVHYGSLVDHKTMRKIATLICPTKKLFTYLLLHQNYFTVTEARFLAVYSRCIFDCIQMRHTNRQILVQAFHCTVKHQLQLLKQGEMTVRRPRKKFLLKILNKIQSKSGKIETKSCMILQDLLRRK